MLSKKFFVVGLLVCMLSISEVRPVLGAEVEPAEGYGGGAGDAPAQQDNDQVFSAARPSAAVATQAKKSLKSKSGKSGKLKLIVMAGIGAAVAVAGVAIGCLCCRKYGVGPFGSGSTKLDAKLAFFGVPETFDADVGKRFRGADYKALGEGIDLKTVVDNKKVSFELKVTLKAENLTGFKLVEAQDDLSAQAAAAASEVKKTVYNKDKLGAVESFKNLPVVAVPAEGKKVADFNNAVADYLAGQFATPSVAGVQVGGVDVNVGVKDVKAENGVFTITYEAKELFDEADKSKETAAIKTVGQDVKGLFQAIYGHIESGIKGVEGYVQQYLPGGTEAANGVRFLTGENDVVAAGVIAGRQQMTLAQIKQVIAERCEVATFTQIGSYGANAADLLKYDDTCKTDLSLFALNDANLSSYKGGFDTLSGNAAKLGVVNPRFAQAPPAAAAAEASG